jgi:hypothetical protein
MKAICTDMAAEQQELDAIVAGLDDPGWNIMTPADGWDIREQIRHLAYYENRARLAASDQNAFIIPILTYPLFLAIPALQIRTLEYLFDQGNIKSDVHYKVTELQTKRSWNGMQSSVILSYFSGKSVFQVIDKIFKRFCMPELTSHRSQL